MNITQSRVMRIGLLFVAVILIYLFLFFGLHQEQQNQLGMSDLAQEQLLQELELESLARFDEPAAAAQYFVDQRAPAGTDFIAPSMYEDGLAQLEAMPQIDIATGQVVDSRAPTAGSPWVEIGPSNFGGRTRGLLIDPNTPTTMYAAGVAGGVWKSTDSGANWSLLDDFMENMAVTTLAFDPASSAIIYAGTGEGVLNADAVRGDGIFKSTDSGATWTQLANTASNSNFSYVMDIVVSHHDSNRLFAATRTGVWRSTDGGTNWTNVHAPSGTVSYCLDLVIRTDGAPNDTVLASCGTFTIPGTVYRTTDSGANWSTVLTEANMARTSLAIAPSDEDTMYALAASNDGSSSYNNGLHAVYRSIDGGSTWITRVNNMDATKLNTVLLSNPYFAYYATCSFGPDQLFNQGWYDNVIAVDPTDPNTIWTGGIDIMKSTDGGANWGLASSWVSAGGASRYVHADIHALVFHPNYDGTTNQILLAGTDGGIHQTTTAAGATSANPCDMASATISWSTLNNGYNVSQFYHGAVYPNGQTFLGGFQDNGTYRGTTAGTSWTSLLGGDGGYVAVDPSNTDNLYYETQNGSFNRSTDGGATESVSVSGISEAAFGFITPFVMDPNNSSRLWIAGRTIWRTDDGAASWTQASTGSATSSPVTALAVQPGNSDLVLVGDGSGNIYRNTSATTADSSTSWSTVARAPGGVTNIAAGVVSSIAFDPNTTSTVYATVSTFGVTHLFRSTDSGATWAAFGGSLPDIPFHHVVVQTGDSDKIYVATDRGIILTTDGGTTWYYTQGYPRVITEWMELATDTGTQYLYAFTHAGVPCAPPPQM